MPRADSSPIISQKLRRDAGSTPDVGSSRKRIGGSCSTAQPSARRWRQPPASSDVIELLAAAQAGHLQRPGDARVALRAAHVVDAGEEQQVLRDRQVLVQREALRHVADAGSSPARSARTMSKPPTVPPPDGRPQDAAQHADRRRLAGAVGSEEAEHRAALDAAGRCGRPRRTGRRRA